MVPNQLKLMTMMLKRWLCVCNVCDLMIVMFFFLILQVHFLWFHVKDVIKRYETFER